MTLERSKTVDEEISAKVVDFLDRNDPRRTNKPFFVAVAGPAQRAGAGAGADRPRPRRRMCRCRRRSGRPKRMIVPSLIVMNARGATLSGGKLTLTGVSPNSIVFADRPVRGAGHALTTHLLEEWAPGNTDSASFTKEPPNATVSAFSKDGSAIRDAVVVLKTPKLEGDRPDLRRRRPRGRSRRGRRAGFDLHRSLRIWRLSRWRVRGWRLPRRLCPRRLCPWRLRSRRRSRCRRVGYVGRAGWYRGVGAVGVGAAAIGGAAIGAAAASAYHPYGYPYAYPAARLRLLPVSALLLSASDPGEAQ